MSDVPRKVLIVKYEPPRNGYVVMMEIRDRTRSLQLSESQGRLLMEEMQRTIVQFAVSSGLVNAADLIPLTPHPLMPNPPKRRKK